MADDLARLEDDLAQGRIDATDFRRRRDALRAGGSTPPPPVPVEGGVDDGVGGGVDDATARSDAPGPAPVGDPFPPPFRWAAARSATGDREDGHGAATSPAAGPPDPAPPAVAPLDPAPPAVVPPGPPAAERTQVVPGTRRPPPPVPAHATLPPWGLAPLAPPVRLDRVRRMQGAEVFVRPAPRRAVAVVGTVVVLVLALAVVLASFLL